MSAYCQRCAVLISAHVEPEPFSGESYTIICRECYQHLRWCEGEAKALAEAPDSEPEDGA